MPGIPGEVIEHKLGVIPLNKPIKQKERRSTPERRETCWQEVNKLLEVGFIRPVDYPRWLANPILVENRDGSWRMCINYTSLKKACPKDEYLLPHICEIVDSTTLCELLSFLDAYSGYHQISLASDDEEKTTFITPFRIFCHTKMAFELKNGGATYQNCVHIILEPQIGRNIKAYIDDIVLKSKKRGDLLDDLKDTFDNLRKYKMILNPKKCMFNVSQENCLAIWYHHGELTQIRRRWKPSSNCNYLGPEKKSISWHALWQHSANSYLSWVNVVCISISYYARQMDFSRMIKRQWPLSNSSSISSPCQHWYHRSPMMCYCCMSQPLMQLSAPSSSLNGQKP
jgi:hypothetical protein